MGERRLWDEYERALSCWRQAGEPGWDRLGLIVTGARQVPWLDDPASPLH